MNSIRVRAALMSAMLWIEYISRSVYHYKQIHVCFITTSRRREAYRISYTNVPRVGVKRVAETSQDVTLDQPTSGLLPAGSLILKTRIWLSRLNPDASWNWVCPKFVNPGRR